MHAGVSSGSAALPPYLRPTSITPTRLPWEGGPTPPASSPAAPPPPPPPSGSSSGSGSSTPDPNNLLAQDTAYIQAQADYKAALDAAGASRDSNTNQALIQFGAVPDFSSIGKSLGLSDAQIAAITGEIANGTGALANQYTQSGNSVLAQLNHAHDQALKQLQASLAARGALESGATGVGVGQENQNYQLGMSNAYDALLKNLVGFQDSYANAAGTARGTLTSALDSAYQRAVQMAEQNPGAGSSTPPPPPGPGGASLPTSSVLARVAAGNPTTVAKVAATVGLPKRRPLVNPYVTGQKVYG